MEIPKIPISPLDPMLIDPGALSLRTLIDLYKLGLPNHLVNAINMVLIRNLNDSACSVEDKPIDFARFMNTIEGYEDDFIKKLKEDYYP